MGAAPGGYRRTVPGAVLVRVKAVCILLTLLHPGGKNIGLSPTLPAFLSPNVAEYLMKHFDLRPTTPPGTGSESDSALTNFLPGKQ